MMDIAAAAVIVVIYAQQMGSAKVEETAGTTSFGARHVQTQVGIHRTVLNFARTKALVRGLPQFMRDGD